MTGSAARRFLRSLSVTGTILATVFFAASLTPSLMPRSYQVQGLLSGLCAAVGYLIGAGLSSLWRYLELPTARKLHVPIEVAVCIAGLLIAVASLWHAVEWQNSIRTLWHMVPLETAYPYRLAAIAVLAFFAAFAIGRAFGWIAIRSSSFLARYVPRRVSLILGVLAAAALFWSLGQGVLLKLALDMTDASFKQLDALLEEPDAPSVPGSVTGGASSLISWEGLGRQGRHYVTSGPGAEDIRRFWSTEALDPLRVYVGLNNADSPQDRATLALKELQRQGGFQRRVLVVIAPTGTGWVDAAAMDPLEYLHRGDVASVAVQYSYLASWLSLLVEPDNGRETTRALFTTIYSYWRTLPKDTRPALYLYGLSLGALNSEASADIYDMVGDPFQGALWVGPPFRSTRWRSITEQRNADSPAWLPRFRDGSVVRFTNQDNHLDEAAAPWGPLRIIYLQYASDPVTFFETGSAFGAPEWMQGQRGPDVSPAFRWIPIITMLQLLFDMMTATESPAGFGHVYAADDYIDCWIAMTAPPIQASEVTRLKDMFGGKLAP
ncbi:alpha/beta hydrolase [Neorhizobium alkalisoli]|uniref:alpha/beta hydrolase n=1 Tax=Neorhizobium alkalisoli TaxID=528178 RepID=UPI000CF96248|nr:alpha/beta-hydrolase family protein [Neorhizobium alkalisoli]